MKKKGLFYVCALLLLMMGVTGCDSDYETDYYTAKVLSYNNVRVSASVTSAPKESRKNGLPDKSDRIYFSPSDLPGHVYEEGGIVLFKIKEAHELEGVFHDQLFLYWDCVVEPVN